jgi:DHA1 family bicyclomycin/chloramphenicol resistance-like MFS transporter
VLETDLRREPANPARPVATLPGRPAEPPAPRVPPVTAGRQVRLVLALGSLVALGPLTIDTYLPALPAISTDLNASSAAVQLTLTGTLVGLAGGQLLIGPLSDAWGRRPSPRERTSTVHPVPAAKR